MRSTLPEIGAHFGVDELPELQVPWETKPEMPGLVIRGVEGERTIHEMRWGFPRTKFDARVGREAIKAVNLIAELPTWEHLVKEPRYRCLIPLTQFAEPEGAKGSKTRTWFGVKGWPIFAWAGFCQKTTQWGTVFAGMTTNSNEAVSPLNDRMPVILKPEEYERWMRCSIGEVIAYQFRKFPAALHVIERTEELWVPLHERGRGFGGPSRGRARPGTLI